MNSLFHKKRAANFARNILPVQTAVWKIRLDGAPEVVVALQLSVKHYLNIAPLTGCPLAAADVNGDGNVTGVDVIAIQRFFIGRTFGTANVGNYQFTPASRNYPNLIGDQTNQNYDTLIFGDVASPFVQ